MSRSVARNMGFECSIFFSSPSAWRFSASRYSTPSPANACEDRFMIIDYVLGAIVTVGLLVYLVYRADPPRAVLRLDFIMTINGWIQIAFYCAIIIAITKPFGGYMTRVFNGERTFLSPLLRPVERVSIRDLRRGREGRPALADLRDRHAGCSASAGFLILYALQRLQAILPFNPQGPPSASISPSTRRSASSPTPTGNPTCPKPR